MPYRLDIRAAGEDALDRLVELGALDVESSDEGIAALLPDTVAPEVAARILGVSDISVSPAIGRDAESVWVLTPPPLLIGTHTLRLVDGGAFGTGLHPTTSLCLEFLHEAVERDRPEAVLDVGTGSGVLALAALMLGVPHVTAIDIDVDALRIAAGNAHLNGLTDRVRLLHGGPDTVAGTWPLILANVAAGPLIEMAPALVRRVGHHGRLVLSGVPASVEADVQRVYCDRGMRSVETRSRGGWVALVVQATW